LFPAERVQKPGEDFYLRTTLILFILAYYCLVKWDNGIMTYSVYSQTAGLLNGVAVALMFYHVVLMILERKMCRTNVSEKHSKFDENIVEKDPNEEKKNSTFVSQSSTVRLTKVKTR
jgi:hypothetical protein